MNINQCMVVMKLVIQNHLDLSYGQKFMIFQMKLYQYPNHCYNYLTKCTDETTKQTEWDRCTDLNKTYKTKAGLKKLQAGVNLLINLILRFTNACKNNRCMGFLHTSNKAQILYKSLFGSLVINFSPGVKKVKTSYMTIQKTL